MCDLSLLTERYVCHSFVTNKGENMNDVENVLDEISEIPQGSVTISDIYAKDQEIIRTYSDLYQKAKCLSAGGDVSMSLDNMIRIPQLYLDRIGATAPDCLGDGSESDAVISDGESVFTLGIKTNAPKKLKYGYVDEKVDTADNEAFAASSEKRTARIDSEAFSPIEYGKTLICLDGQTGDLSAPVTLPNGTTVYSLFAKGGSKDFTKGINTLLDTVFALLARGLDREKIGLCIKYGFPMSAELDGETRLGKSLALFLGAYRVMIELCIPDARAEAIMLDAKESSLLCAAYSDETPKKISNDLFDGEGELYLLSFNRGENGMPDFESVRKMCKYLGALINEGKALSVRFFDGALSKELRQTESEEYAVQINEGADGICTQGFIIRSSAALSAKVIGKVIQKETENDDEE